MQFFGKSAPPVGNAVYTTACGTHSYDEIPYLGIIYLLDKTESGHLSFFELNSIESTESIESIEFVENYL